MKRIVLYSSNSKHRDSSSNCTVFPSWASQWDEVAARHPDCEIYLVVQLNGRYFLDIYDGELSKEPQRIHVVTLPMKAKQPEFVEAVAALEPDVAVAMPGPVSGYDWNGLRDAAIAEGLRQRGIDTYCYTTKTALDCFDKWRTHQVLKEAGFNVADALYLHYELFTTNKLGEACTGNVYQEYVLWEIQNMEMPVVIKSTTGSSSMGIYVAQSFEDAKQYLLSDQLVEDVIIEQFLAGEEYGVEIHGDRGNYIVSYPFRIFNTQPGGLKDPLGTTWLKYGPILDEDLHVEELRRELQRMAELMEFSGIINIDLVLVDGAWYFLEVNNRWSGVTTLVTASQGRLPYDVFVDQVIEPSIDYNDPANMTFACQFKMLEAGVDVLEQIAAEPTVTSIIQYDVRLPGRDPFIFCDSVTGGYASMDELLDGFDALQQKYPQQIPARLTQALREREQDR